MADGAIIVFARALRAGRVKTRLIPELGEQGALDVYTRLLDRTLAVCHRSGRPVILYGSEPHPSLQERAAHYRMALHPQRGGDLAGRMAHAFDEQHGRGHERLVMVGSDCPCLTVDYLENALSALESHDFVLGPAEDGGYVLLGSRLPAVWQPGPLAGTRLGTARALADTRSALASLGRVGELEALWDLDDADDWRRAREGGFLD